jgi:nucleoside-diphosphate-sugar epimerase
LERGYIVHGTVRDLSHPEKYTHLTSLPGAAERLTLFKADLLEAGSFDAALKDTEEVLHVASPFHFNGGEEELVTPAVKGTLNVLQSVEKHPNIKRVVLTSSVAAVAFNGGKLPSTHIYTEADWSDAEYQRSRDFWYPLSKTLAEQAAWDHMKNTKAFSLVVINPCMVVGPMLQKSLNTSSETIGSYLDGTKKVIPQSTMGFIDVRDVAEVHILALETPSASGRYLMIQSSTPWEKICNELRKITEGKKYAIPTEVAKGDPPTPMLFDCTKAIKLLGRSFRSWEESVAETVKSLEEHGFVKQ